VLVYEMSRASSAFRAGVRPGDVIQAFNGQNVTDDSQVRKMIADAKIGSTATLDLLREGQRLQLRVPIAAPAALRSR
jgi:serine protease Do